MPTHLGVRMREPITIDFSAAAKLSDLPDHLAQFVAWWVDELGSMLPWRRESGVSARHAVIYARPDRWFLRASPDTAAVALDTDMSDGDLADRVLHAANGTSLSKLTLLLPRESVITRRIELPQMSLAHARQAVDLQIDRLSPFKADAVRTAARIAGHDAEKGAMLVDVAIVPLVRVRPIEQRLQALGLIPAAIDVEGDNGVPQGFDLREPQTADELRRRRRLRGVLVAAAVAIWGLALYAWGQSSDSEVQAWEVRIAELRPAAERSAALKQDVEGLAVPVARANAHNPAVVLDVLQQLTRLLPDTVQVLDLKIEGSAVRVAGLAASAPDLIGLLEVSNSFKDVKFVSPVVRKSETGVERFEIAMQREVGPQ